MIFLRPDVVRDAALTAMFWIGYASGLIRGFTSVIMHRLPLLGAH